MALIFKGSKEPTIGVEIELQILDPITLDLSAKSEMILEKCKELGLERIKAEIHQSMLEIDSEISKDVKECRAFLKARMQQLNNVASELHLELGISGTHPFQWWKDRLISKQERYQNIHQKYQWLARRMNVYGLHVHIGVESGEKVLAISNALVRFLPHLLALSANSPFWQGINTGMQSCRLNIMESFPHGGIPLRFRQWSDFEYYCETLKKAHAISSLKDLYWFIRPNLEFGTIEFRVCDAMSTLDETMAVVALIQSLVVFANQKLNHDNWIWTKEQQWIESENQWRATRDGLKGFIMTPSGQKQQISESIKQLIELLGPTAQYLNCKEELLYIKHILNEGNGAQRQCNLFKRTRSLRDIVSAYIHDYKNDAMNEKSDDSFVYDQNFA